MDSDQGYKTYLCLICGYIYDEELGVLGSVEAIAAIAEIVADYPEIPLILDPVLASGRGDELANEDMLSALRDLILPQTSLVTPNTMELLRLAYDEIS